MTCFYSGGYRGDSYGSLDPPPPLRQNPSIFLSNFQKNQHRISNNQSQLPNRPPPHFVNLNPYQEILDSPLLLLFILFYHSVFTWAIPYGTHMEPGCTPHMGAHICTIWAPYKIAIWEQPFHSRKPAVYKNYWLAHVLEYQINRCHDSKAERGRSGGTLIFASYVGSGPASTILPQKISGISSTPKNIWNFSNPKKYPQFCTLALRKKKQHKIHVNRNDP